MGIVHPFPADRARRPEPAVDEVVHIGDVAEMWDNGKRLVGIETAGLTEAVSAVQRMRLEMGETRASLARERLEEQRDEMEETMKIVDTVEYRDVHTAIGERLVSLNSLIHILRERES